MRRLEVRFLDGAQGDLDDIYQFVLERSRNEAIAQGYVTRLIDTCERIGDAARAGQPRDDLRPGLRTWSFERRVAITYVIRGEVVEIVNLFAGGRDLYTFYSRRKA